MHESDVFEICPVPPAATPNGFRHFYTSRSFRPLGRNGHGREGWVASITGSEFNINALPRSNRLPRHFPLPPITTESRPQ